MTGAKRIEVRSKSTTYRGKLLITSSKTPKGARAGMTICMVELYDVKPLSQLTREEMYATGIPEQHWKDYRGFGWFLKNPYDVRNVRVKGMLGIWTLTLEKWDLYHNRQPERTGSSAAMWILLIAALGTLLLSGIGYTLWFLSGWLFR